MYFLSGMEGFKKSEGRSTRGASSLQYRLRPPPQSWMRPYDSCSSAPTALMKELSTANLLSIHVLILRIFVFGGATRIVGAGSCQSQIWLCTVVLLANPLPGASGLEKLTKIQWRWFRMSLFRYSDHVRSFGAFFGHFWPLLANFGPKVKIVVNWSYDHSKQSQDEQKSDGDRLGCHFSDIQTIFCHLGPFFGHFWPFWQNFAQNSKLS